jgi:hypothetical protein
VFVSQLFRYYYDRVCVAPPTLRENATATTFIHTTLLIFATTITTTTAAFYTASTQYILSDTRSSSLAHLCTACMYRVYRACVDEAVTKRKKAVARAVGMTVGITVEPLRLIVYRHRVVVR